MLYVGRIWGMQMKEVRLTHILGSAQDLPYLWHAVHPPRQAEVNDTDVTQRLSTRQQDVLRLEKT